MIKLLFIKLLICYYFLLKFLVHAFFLFFLSLLYVLFATLQSISTGVLSKPQYLRNIEIHVTILVSPIHSARIELNKIIIEKFILFIYLCLVVYAVMANYILNWFYLNLLKFYVSKNYFLKI